MAEVAAAAPAQPRPEPQKSEQFQQNSQDIAPAPPTVPSQQVANTKLALNEGPKPPSQYRDIQARETHNQAMQNDRDRVAAEQAAFIEKLAQRKANRERFNEAAQVQEQHRDRGMGR